MRLQGGRTGRIVSLKPRNAPVRTHFVRTSAAVVVALALAGGGRSGEGHAAAQSAGNVFQQASADGLVVMEAENFSANMPGTGSNDTWTLVTAPAGASGNAMTCGPDDGTAFRGSTAVPPEPFAPDISPRLDFTVLFVATGTHYVWVRGRGLDGASDSCHVGLDGAAVVSAERINSYTLTAPTPYEWRTLTMSGPAATIDVATTGIHTVNLWMREDGFSADRILLTTNASYAGVSEAGTMIGPAESAQVPDPRPGVPTNLTAAPGPGGYQITLNWTAGANATSYEVLRGTVSGGPYTVVASGVTATTYTDGGLLLGTTYYYVVRSVNSFGTSANSNQASAMPANPPPRTNDHSEGLFEDKCGCGSVGTPRAALLLAWAALAAGFAFFLRRPA